jgi:hypothetical protein
VKNAHRAFFTKRTLQGERRRREQEIIIMINKDYILRLVEKFGRYLAIILQLRQYNRYEEALIYIDDLLLKTTGFTSRFINSLSEEMLLKTFSPLGTLNVEACLWTALLLKAEGEIYEDQQNTDESYYRYLKALHLMLAALLHEPVAADTDFYATASELLTRLADYELPVATQSLLFAYYEHSGQYAKAEDTLFEMLETGGADQNTIERGAAFYRRLLARSESDLAAGNFSREEAEEGLAQMKRKEQR